MKEYFKAIKNYANFEGRARRSEYWMFVLFYAIFFILVLVLANVMSAMGVDMLGAILMVGLTLFHIIPQLSVTVRRLHDTDKSGWWLLLALVPVVGPIALLVFYCTEGTPGPNQYGPDPKGRGGSLQDSGVLDSDLV